MRASAKSVTVVPRSRATIRDAVNPACSSWPRSQASRAMLVWQTFCTCSMTLSSHSNRWRPFRAAQRVFVFLVHVLHVPQVSARPTRMRRSAACTPLQPSCPTTMMCLGVHGELHHRQAVECGAAPPCWRYCDERRRGPAQQCGCRTDPQVVGRLLARKFGEKLRVLAANAFRPLAVVLGRTSAEGLACKLF